MALIKNDQRDYVSVLSDGTLRLSVPEGTEGAIKREYETSDGSKGVKNELVFKSITGSISDVRFFEGDYGNLLQLEIVDGEQELILSLNTTQNFAEDLMKKLPNISNFETPVKITPYSFTDDNGKLRKGITLEQDGEKIKNHFYDEEKKANTNGYPEPEGDVKKYDKDDWKIYFTKARKYLVEYTKKNVMTNFHDGEF